MELSAARSSQTAPRSPGAAHRAPAALPVVDAVPALTRATLRVPALPHAATRAAREGAPPPPLVILEVLHDLPGVQQITVETERGAVMVAFDGEQVDLPAIRAALQRAGFATPFPKVH